jgi:hypothetical protein
VLRFADVGDVGAVRETGAVVLGDRSFRVALVLRVDRFQFGGAITLCVFGLSALGILKERVGRNLRFDVLACDSCGDVRPLNRLRVRQLGASLFADAPCDRR